jgi:hypothetical protein
MENPENKMNDLGVPSMQETSRAIVCVYIYTYVITYISYKYIQFIAQNPKNQRG